MIIKYLNKKYIYIIAKFSSIFIYINKVKIYFALVEVQRAKLSFFHN